MELPERFAGDGLYPRFHSILNDPPCAMNLNTQRVLRTFAIYVHDRILRPTYFRKVLGRNMARDLLRIADDVHRQYGKFVRGG